MSDIEVFVDQRRAGALGVMRLRGRHTDSLTFTYDHEWLTDPRSFAISPDLPLAPGMHHPAPHQQLFGAFNDAAPDSWGRELLQAEADRRARAHHERLRRLSDLEMLLAVDDATRQGALRFRRSGQFVGSGTGAPAIGELGKLAAAAERFQETGAADEFEDMQELVHAGSSPGGAQPKAWVRGEDGKLMLAKFPRTSAVADVSGWERTTMELQRQAGITVSNSTLVRMNPWRSIFLTDRFDREGERRIPYWSFKQAFQIPDYHHLPYSELAERLAVISARPDQDARELFARAAFSAMCNNIDDHMRNHGLLWAGQGWRLAPSFDVNPATQGVSDTPLTPQDDPAARDVRTLLDAADSFRMTRQQAAARLAEIGHAVAQWKPTATRFVVEPEEVDGFGRRVFENDNVEFAVALAPQTRPE